MDQTRLKGAIDLRHGPLTLHVAQDERIADIPLKAAVTDNLHDGIDETLG